MNRTSVPDQDTGRLRRPPSTRILLASADIAFVAPGGEVERYAHLNRLFDYSRRSRHDRGVPLRYIQHTNGYSRAQVTRLVG